MKDKQAREMIEALRKEVRQDYTISSERFAQIREAHKRLLKYLNLEVKHSPSKTVYIKWRKP